MTRVSDYLGLEKPCVNNEKPALRTFPGRKDNVASARGLLDLMRLLEDQKPMTTGGPTPGPVHQAGPAQKPGTDDDEPGSQDTNNPLLNLLSKLPKDLLAELLVKLLQWLLEKDKPKQASAAPDESADPLGPVEGGRSSKLSNLSVRGTSPYQGPSPDSPLPAPDSGDPTDAELERKPWYQRLAGVIRKGRDVITGLCRRFTDILDGFQGDNGMPGWNQNCGIVSCLNVLRMAGRTDLDETKLTRYAAENGLCFRGGGTYPGHRLELLRRMGVDAEHRSVSMEDLAKAVDQKKGVIVSLNAQTLGRQSTTPLGQPNHAVTVTGVVRDKQTGQIRGFLICNSGGGGTGKANFVPYEVMRAACGGNGRVAADITRRSLAA